MCDCVYLLCHDDPSIYCIGNQCHSQPCFICTKGLFSMPQIKLNIYSIIDLIAFVIKQASDVWHILICW